MKTKRLFIFILVITFFPPTLLAQSSQLLLDVPVIIKGEKLSKFNAKDIAKIRVFSFKNGQASVIPFQIDQHDSKGDWIWEVANKKGSTHDDDDPLNSKLLDSNDEMLFMTNDLGDKASIKSIASITSSIIEQVQVNIPGSNKVVGWAYIAYFPSQAPSLSSKRYMNFYPDELRIQSPVYQMAYDDKYIALMNLLDINGLSKLDRLKKRGEVNVGFLMLGSTIEFNEEDVDGYPAGYINGAIRTVKRVVNYVKLGIGLHSPSLNCDHLYYPNHAEVPIMLSRGAGVKNMSIRIGLDFHQSTFDKLYADGLQKVMSVNSETIGISTDLSTANWILLSSPSGTLFSTLKTPEKLQPVVSVSSYVSYDSHKIELPEKFPGTEPGIGVFLKTKKGFPKGEYLVYMNYAILAQTATPDMGEKLNQILAKPMEVVINSIPIN